MKSNVLQFRQRSMRTHRSRRKSRNRAYLAASWVVGTLCVLQSCYFLVFTSTIDSFSTTAPLHRHQRSKSFVILNWLHNNNHLRFSKQPCTAQKWYTTTKGTTSRWNSCATHKSLVDVSLWLWVWKEFLEKATRKNNFASGFQATMQPFALTQSSFVVPSSIN